MVFTKHILPALAFAAVALAQCSGPVEIQNQGDADALASCTTYKGDITISSVTAGNLAINGIRQITGGLSCQNAGNLLEISADQLNSIGGTFNLYNLTILSTLAFSSLTEVNVIEWVSLPGLQSLNFPQGVSQANNVLISNTELNTLQGIQLETVGNIDINNNPYLNTVNVNEMVNITGSLNFAANSQSLAVSFPNLIGANNMTFRNVASVSVPSLDRVNGSLGFYSDSFTSFSAPNLTSTGGTLAFVDCPNLKNISMPVLKVIGGGFLINDTGLDAIVGFPELATIVGALDFAGSFDTASLPALKDVRGGANIQTSSTSFDCSPFQADKADSVIKGVFTCANSQSNPNTNPNGATSGTGPKATGKNIAGSFDPSAPLTGLSALLAALLMI